MNKKKSYLTYALCKILYILQYSLEFDSILVDPRDNKTIYTVWTLLTNWEKSHRIDGLFGR